MHEKYVASPRSYVSEEKFHPDDGEYYCALPYSDINGYKAWYIEGRDDFYLEADEHLPYWRLSSVRQLSLLGYVGYEKDKVYSIPFEHDRLVHTLQTARISEFIAQNNNLSERDTRLLITAALLHDIATPALGDAVKKIDPFNLDEETYWYEMLDEKGWEFLKKQGFDFYELDEIVHNKGGYLGEVLDIADKIAYTIQDASRILGNTDTFNVPRDTLMRVQFPDLEFIAGYLKHSEGQLGNIYKDVRINTATSDVHFTDPDRLWTFLSLRAILFHSLYMNPYSIGRDFLYEKVLERFYSVHNTQKLTPSKLRNMIDNSLLRELAKKMNLDPFFDFTIINWHPDFKKFKSKEEAEMYSATLDILDPSLFILGVKDCPGFNPGTHMLIADEETGKLIPFNEKSPRLAKPIEDLAEDTRASFVFYETMTDETKWKIGPIVNFLKNSS